MVTESIPVIDLADLHGPDTETVLEKLASACLEYGSFELVNHGIPEVVSKNVLESGEMFFARAVECRKQYCSYDPLPKLVKSVLPMSKPGKAVFTNTAEYRQQYHSDDPFSGLPLTVSTEFVLFHCYPQENYMDSWPSQPRGFREGIGDYCRHVRSLVLDLLPAISESLGLKPDFVDKALGKHAQQMAINHHPKCPNPNLTYRLPGHSAQSVLTVLQGDLSGLQVLKNGQWVAVEPLPNAFIVSVGDQLQVLSNGVYKSPVFREVVNSSQAPVSITTYYGALPDAVIQPASPLNSEKEGIKIKAMQQHLRELTDKIDEAKTIMEMMASTLMEMQADASTKHE